MLDAIGYGVDLFDSAYSTAAASAGRAFVFPISEGCSSSALPSDCPARDDNLDADSALGAAEAMPAGELAFEIDQRHEHHQTLLDARGQVPSGVIKMKRHGAKIFSKGMGVRRFSGREMLTKFPVKKVSSTLNERRMAIGHLSDAISQIGGHEKVDIAQKRLDFVVVKRFDWKKKVVIVPRRAAGSKFGTQFIEAAQGRKHHREILALAGVGAKVATVANK